MIKNSPANARDARDIGSIPGSGRSLGEGHGNPLHYSCLENPMDRGAWWATVHVAWTLKNLPAMQETGFDPWVRKIPCRREWQTTPVSLPEKFHGQRSPVGYSPWGLKESIMTEHACRILLDLY